MSRNKNLNLHKDAKDPRGHALCPFRFSHFGIGKKLFGSVESFMLAFRVVDSPSDYIRVSMGTAMEARKIAGKLPIPDCVIWEDREISLESQTFERLFVRMMRVRFRHDAHAVSALWASKSLKFVHQAPTRGAPVSVVPIRLYCRTLEQFRDELHTDLKIAKPAAA